MVAKFAQHNYMALILGGSSGLGLAAAKKLAAEGMGICIVHRNGRAEMDEINKKFESIKSTGIVFLSFNADAANEEKRKEILTALAPYQGQFRCLLHSIAKGSLKAMMPDDASEPLSAEDIKVTLDYMACSLYDWTAAMFRAGLFAEDARVLAFTSEGSHRALKHYAAVAIAKAAMEAIVRNMALEFAPSGIRVNCIQAGTTPTASMKKIPGSDAIQSFSIARNPFKRMTTPEDVANVVYLLCTDEAAWINGSIIPVDGGEHIC
jgi:enoyl-[acyl-carrier protein] reductase III